MDIKKAIKFVGSQVEDLEKAVYHFESVVHPRFERDKEILAAMREQHLKLQALQEKEERGEELTQEDIYAAVPSQFR